MDSKARKKCGKTACMCKNPYSVVLDEGGGVVLCAPIVEPSLLPLNRD